MLNTGARMTLGSPGNESSLRRAHPLAARLIARRRELAGRRILELGIGSGRNTAVLLDAGFTLVSIDDDAQRIAAARPRFGGRDVTFVICAYTRAGEIAGRFDAALSTHALLHGCTPEVAGAVGEAAKLLAPGALFFATFGSTRDARFGLGTRLDERTWAQQGGDEPSVPHAYFTQHELRAMLEPFFSVQAMQERRVDAVVGRWAHAERPRGHVHWMVEAARL